MIFRTAVSDRMSNDSFDPCIPILCFEQEVLLHHVFNFKLMSASTDD